jgi:hypothetical protein
LGTDPLTGYLVVDRYAGYNHVKCKIQYCYAHLLREVIQLEKEFPENGEVKIFVATFAPLLSEAMHIGNQNISDRSYYSKAKKLKKQIIACVESPAHNFGIQHIQRIFIENSAKLYHWVDDRDVPSHNNFAERSVRGTVIARKISYGSQSEDGAKTRSTLMSVLHTVNSRLQSREKLLTWLRLTLDSLAEGVKPENLHALLPPLDCS